MTVGAAQADAFYREAVDHGCVWTIRDEGGLPAPMTDSGQRAMPFWSLRSRAQRVVETVPAYAGFAVVPFIARGLVPTFASGWRILFLIGALGGATILFMRRGLPPSPRWLVSQGRTEEAREMIAEAEETALEVIDGDRLPEPEPVPDEAPAEE